MLSFHTRREWWFQDNLTVEGEGIGKLELRSGIWKGKVARARRMF
jgi:hypothetical protein